jgi:hypothetical protein
VEETAVATDNPLFSARALISFPIGLRNGRNMSLVEDGKIISVADARRMVAHARAQGWLAMEAA